MSHLETLVPLFHPITMFSGPFLVSASCNYFELWLVHWIGSLCPLWLARVISLFLIFWHSTGHVWYINIPTWLRDFQEKLPYLVLFSLYPGLFWEMRDKRNLKSLQFWPESLGLNHVRILIYRTRPIENRSKLPKKSTFSLDWVFSTFCYLPIIRQPFVFSPAQKRRKLAVFSMFILQKI